MRKEAEEESVLSRKVVAVATPKKPLPLALRRASGRPPQLTSTPGFSPHSRNSPHNKPREPFGKTIAGPPRTPNTSLAPKEKKQTNESTTTREIRTHRKSTSARSVWGGGGSRCVREWRARARRGGSFWGRTVAVARSSRGGLGEAGRTFEKAYLGPDGAAVKAARVGVAGDGPPWQDFPRGTPPPLYPDSPVAIATPRARRDRDAARVSRDRLSRREQLSRLAARRRTRASYFCFVFLAFSGCPSYGLNFCV